MKIKITSYSSQSSLLSAIAALIIGAILFTKSDVVLSFISISLGIVLSIIAIIQFIFYSFQIKKEETPKKSLLIGATLSLLIAIIFIFFHSIVEQFIRFIIGAWILFTGIMRFINSLSLSKTKKFLPLLIVSVLLMIVGIYTIITPDVFIKYIGAILMLYAAIEITGYIFYSKDTMVSEETGSTTLIVNDNPIIEEEIDTKKDKKIKDVKEKKSSSKKTKKNKDKKDSK